MNSPRFLPALGGFPDLRAFFGVFCRVLLAGVLLAGGVLPLGAAVKYDVVTSFVSGPQHPGSSRLLLHPDGNFYGVTRGGGAGTGQLGIFAGAGTLYRLTPQGEMSVVVHFKGAGSPERGEYPSSNLYCDENGDLWGTAKFGGSAGEGTVFKVNVKTGVLETILDFSGFANENPDSGLVDDGLGFLWGTTAEFNGTIYKINKTTRAATSVLSFTNRVGPNKGYSPEGELLADGAGFIWGTTSSGGTDGLGTIYKVNAVTGVLMTIAEFTGTTGATLGQYPSAGLVRAPDGLFWGSTSGGGAFSRGTIFKLDPATGILTTVVQFRGTGTVDRGDRPTAEVSFDAFGNVWGTTERGGTGDYGTVFKISPASGSLVTAAEFTNNGLVNKGRIVDGGLVDDGAGHFWGTTGYGGGSDLGVVYKIDMITGQLTTLVEFERGLPGFGTSPGESFIPDGLGNFWAVTGSGGYSGAGTIMKLTPETGEVTTVYEFADTSSLNTSSPNGILQDASGRLWGVSYAGGSSDYGHLFRFDPNTGVSTTLGSFTSGVGGRYPGKIIDPGDGFYWGTCSYGGSNDLGTVFKINTSTGAISTVVSFNGSGTNKGARPGGLYDDGNGNVWGLTGDGGVNNDGTVFRVNKGTGVLTTVAELGTLPNLAFSYTFSNLVSDGAGFLWGAVGDNLFKVNMSTGELTLVLQFTGSSLPYKGTRPSQLIDDGKGNFWGTTESGGAGDAGTIFRYHRATGEFTTVVELSGISGSTPGNSPRGLFQDASGDFFGVTSGGPQGGGIFFRLRLGPVPRTNAAETLASGSIRLKGTINPNGQPAQGQFEWGPTQGLGFTTPPVDLGEGTADVPIEHMLSDLVPNATYYFRAKVTSEVGVEYGQRVAASVRTLPAVTSGAVAVLTQTFATVNAMVNARGVTTNVVFEYGADGVNFPNSIAASPSMVTGQANSTVTATLTGLTSGQTYYFRVVATNSVGLSAGSPLAFSTLAQPAASLGAPAVVLANGATLHGLANAAGNPATVAFEYGTDGLNFPNSIAANSSPINGVADTAVSAVISNLSEGTTYHYRLKVVGAGGEATSGSASFTTLALPGVTGLAAANPGSSTATLAASVDAHALSTNVVFEYGPGAGSLPFSVVATPGTLSGNGAVAVSAAIGGLQPETTYFFRVRAVSAAGTVTTSVLNFATSASARAVTGAGSASFGVTNIVATLNGTVNGFGQATSVSFDYGTNANNLDQSAGATPGSVTGTNDTTVSASVPGLAQGTTYYFRVKASNGGGATVGAVQQFTTPSKGAVQAEDDYIFYAGAVRIEPLRNDVDPDANPLGDTSRLSIDTQLVQAPTVSQNVATVVSDGRAISYDPEFNVKEQDTLIYRVHDSFGGEDTATVNLITFQSRAGLYQGVVNDVVNAPGRAGTVSILLSSGGFITTAFGSWQSESYRLKGQFDQFGERTAVFTSDNDARVTLTLTLALGKTTKVINGSLVERTDGVETARVPAFTLVLNGGSGGLAAAGVRTAFLSAPPALVTNESGDRVMGDGYVVMTVAKNRRSARMVGQLPDGEPFMLTSAAQGRSFAMTKTLERGGMLSGLVRVVGDDAGESSGMMANLLWKKRAVRNGERARYFGGGVNTSLELLGIKYPVLAKTAPPPLELDPGVGMNARLSLSGGDLPSAQEIPIRIQGSSVTGLDAGTVKLQLQPDLGTFSGSFKHPATGKFVPFKGAFRVPLDTEPGQGRGVFRGPTEAGAVRIEAN